MSLKIDRIGESWYATNQTGVLQFSNIHESGATLSAEITATSTATGAQHWSRLNLAAPRSRSDLAKALAESCQGPSWPTMLDEACQRVVLAMRQGAPAVPIKAVQPSPTRWLVPGLIPVGETTVLYGDGGTMKSLLALTLAWSALSRRQVAPSWDIAPVSAALYLDWESRAEEHEGRWWGLSAAVGIDAPDGLHYLPMERTLCEAITHVQKAQADTAADLVIFDSMAPACGAEPEGSDAAVRTMTAIRSIPATRIVVAHVSKAVADLHGPTRPFGSVFVRNLARSTIEAKLAEDLGETDSPALVTYYHTKANSGRRQPPTALSWLFTSAGYISVEQGQVDQTHAPIPAQILAELGRGKETVSSLARNLGQNPSSVKSALGRLEDAGKVIRLESVSGGRGKETLWGRVDRNRCTPNQ